MTCFVKINEEIIEIWQKTSDIFIVHKKLMWDISTTLALFFNEVLERILMNAHLHSIIVVTFFYKLPSPCKMSECRNYHDH